MQISDYLHLGSVQEEYPGGNGSYSVIEFTFRLKYNRGIFPQN